MRWIVLNCWFFLFRWRTQTQRNGEQKKCNSTFFSVHWRKTNGKKSTWLNEMSWTRFAEIVLLRQWICDAFYVWVCLWFVFFCFIPHGIGFMLEWHTHATHWIEMILHWRHIKRNATEFISHNAEQTTCESASDKNAKKTLLRSVCLLFLARVRQ